MRDRPGEEVKLILRALPSGQQVSIGCRKTTAQLFGWLEHFETQEERTARLVREGFIPPRFARYPMLQNGLGRPIRLVVDAQRRYTIRIGAKVTIGDLSELARFTSGSWLWMERPDRKRWTREQWLTHYETRR